VDQLRTSVGRSLEDRLEANAEPWKPNVNDNDTVVGTVIDVDSRTTEFGMYPIVTVATDAGDEVAVHAFHTVLKNEFAKRPPQLGERLGIKYLGKHAKGYEAYRIVWEKTPAPDWNRIGAEAQAEAVVEGVEEEHPTQQASQDEDIPF
jgi:hypothetical protein